MNKINEDQQECDGQVWDIWRHNIGILTRRADSFRDKQQVMFKTEDQQAHHNIQ